MKNIRTYISINPYKSLNIKDTTIISFFRKFFWIKGYRSYIEILSETFFIKETKVILKYSYLGSHNLWKN